MDSQTIAAPLSHDNELTNPPPHRARRPNYYMVPPWCKKNPYFVGRHNLIETLRAMLQDENPCEYKHCVALFGPGGVGKTETAVEYVMTQSNMYDNIFWITAKDSSGLLLGFQNIAKKTKCTNESDSNKVAA